jgi:hypothetical protein
MKPTGAKKQRQNKGEKEGEMKDNKKLHRKKRKGNLKNKT